METLLNYFNLWRNWFGFFLRDFIFHLYNPVWIFIFCILRNTHRLIPNFPLCFYLYSVNALIYLQIQLRYVSTYTTNLNKYRYIIRVSSSTNIKYSCFRQNADSVLRRPVFYSLVTNEWKNKSYWESPISPSNRKYSNNSSKNL